MTALALIASVVATGGACSPSRDGPLPSPDELGAAPFGPGASVGGVDATYVISEDESAERDSPCYGLLRLTADGEARMALGCSGRGPESAADQTSTWDADEVDVGDYAIEGDRWSLRMVGWDSLTTEDYLYTLDGVGCGDRLILRNPEFRNARGLREYRLLVGAPPVQAEPCDLPRFEIEKMPWRTVAGSGVLVEIRVLTEPAAVCSLSYARPDGRRWPEAGTFDVVADREGRCVLRWPVGELAGLATAWVTVGPITHELEFELI
jgi:hypothetical protein